MTVLHIIPKINGLFDSEWTHSFHLDTPTPVTPADIPELLPTITDWLQDMFDNIAGFVAVGITATEYLIRIIDLIDGSEVFLGQGNWTFAGTGVGDSLPAQVSPTISLPAAGRKRPAQKRMMPPTEPNQDRGQLTPNTITAYTNFALEWLDGPNATVNFTLTPVLWSRDEIEAFDLSGVINIGEFTGTVGSRKPGVGS